MNRLIVIIGPTAVGKTDIAMQLAKQFGCEIVSGDSMCVYRGMDIGTAKPSLAERLMIPHHLIDILDSGESFSVVDFQKLAAIAIDDINRRGHIPLLVGGTGLYVQALLEGFHFSPTPKTQLRKELEGRAAEEPATTDLYQKLLALDPETAAHIHPADHKRIIRALEVVMLEHQPVSRSRASEKSGLLFDCLVFGLRRNRAELYRRIEERVDGMVARGLVDEVKKMLSNGIPAEATSMQAIGYKEMVCHIRGDSSLVEAVARIKQSSRRYAKRQLTWFRRMPYIRWIDMDEANTGEEMLANMTMQVAEKFSIR